MYYEYCFFEVRKRCFLIVAKRVTRQEKVLNGVVVTKDDRAINALLSFAKNINKDFDIRITDAVEKIGGLALEIFDVSIQDRKYIKEEFIRHLKEELRER